MMRKTLFLLLSLALSGTVAHADTLPVGTYSLSAFTPTSGIHSGSDVGTMSGTLVFDSASSITFANLAFDDQTSHLIFTFTQPGATTIDASQHLLFATISNAIDPKEYFQFSIRTPTVPPPAGAFTLTCGTDCDNWMLVNDGTTPYTYVEVQGSIVPTPEPSTLMLLATGGLTVVRSLRRRAT